MDDKSPASVAKAVHREVSTVLVGYESILDGLTRAILTGGHVLLEGNPGVAKTTIAKAYTAVTDLDYSRIQMTPDLLPADVTGTRIFDAGSGAFDIQEGPVFTNVVLVDEINRATPKTQSALLEAMEERAVTIAGEQRPLPSPFIVIATQNPIEQDGTYDLPIAQRDRFQAKYTLDIPTESQELAILDRFDAEPTLQPASLDAQLGSADIAAARTAVADVHVSKELKQYIRDIVAATREDPNVEHGASPRAMLALLESSKAEAALNGREYVIPDDVKSLLGPVLGHRLVLNMDASLREVTETDVVASVATRVTPPGSEPTEEATAEPDG